jgi:hypothetical protein
MIDEYSYYVQNYHLIEPSKEQIIQLLPDSRSEQYHDIISRLLEESMHDIKEMTELSMEVGSFESDEVQSFIRQEQQKIEILNQLLEKEEEFEEDSHNNLFLITSKSGRVKVLDDLERIPVDYYDEVGSLMSSIQDGTFKRFKKFNKSSDLNLAGISEVRGKKVRILFDGIGNDTYGIITVFLKKADNEKVYREFIRCRIQEYRTYEDVYRKAILDSEVMESNRVYLDEFWSKIGYSKDKTFEKVK